MPFDAQDFVIPAGMPFHAEPKGSISIEFTDDKTAVRTVTLTPGRNLVGGLGELKTAAELN